MGINKRKHIAPVLPSLHRLPLHFSIYLNIFIIHQSTHWAGPRVIYLLTFMSLEVILDYLISYCSQVPILGRAFTVRAHKTVEYKVQGRRFIILQHMAA